MMPLSGFPYLSEHNPSKCHGFNSPAITLTLPLTVPYTFLIQLQSVVAKQVQLNKLSSQCFCNFWTFKNEFTSWLLWLAWLGHLGQLRLLSFFFPFIHKEAKLGIFHGVTAYFPVAREDKAQYITYKFLVLLLVNASLPKVDSMVKSKNDVGEDYKRARLCGYIIQWWHYQNNFIGFYYCCNKEPQTY